MFKKMMINDSAEINVIRVEIVLINTRIDL